METIDRVREARKQTKIAYEEAVEADEPTDIQIALKLALDHHKYVIERLENRQ